MKFSLLTTEKRGKVIKEVKMSTLLKALIQKNTTPVINSIRKSSCSGDVPRILITGGLGQLGMGLADVLAAKYGNSNVIITDINKPKKEFFSKGIYFLLMILKPFF